MVSYSRKGGIFPENSDDLITAFQNAVRILNTSNELLKLQAVTATVDTNDSFEVQKAGSYIILSTDFLKKYQEFLIANDFPSIFQFVR